MDNPPPQIEVNLVNGGDVDATQSAIDDLDIEINEEDLLYILGDIEEKKDLPMPQIEKEVNEDDPGATHGAVDDLDIELNEDDLLYILADIEEEKIVENTEKVSIEAVSIQKIIHEKVRFREAPLGPPMPKRAYTDRVKCHVMGFDYQGYVFISFPVTEDKDPWLESLRQMNAVYQSMDVSNMQIKAEETFVGEVLVGRVVDKIENRNICYFLRVQVVQINLDTNRIFAVDIDEHELHSFTPNNLFYLLEGFYNFETKSTKCILGGLEDFVGTGVVTDALWTTYTGEPSMYVHQIIPETPKNKQQPVEDAPFRIVLYSDVKSKVSDVLSFNMEVMEAIQNWNKAPLDLTQGLILTHVHITGSSPEGELSIQLQSNLMSMLANLQPRETLAIADSQDVMKAVAELLEKENYVFVKKTKEGLYRRVTVCAESSVHRIKYTAKNVRMSDEVKFKYTDYGSKKHICCVKELIPFKYFLDILQDVPEQCFEATLQPWEHEYKVTISPNSQQILENAEVRVVIHQESSKMGTELPQVAVYFRKRYKDEEQPCKLVEEARLQCRGAAAFHNPNANKFSFVRYEMPLDDVYMMRRERQFEHNLDHEELRLNYKNYVFVLDSK